MNEQVLWTDLSLKDIIAQLLAKGFPVGKYIVKQWLRKQGYVKRKASKSEPIGSCANRDEQFHNIARLKEEYQEAGNPIISIDTKKKERLGNLYRDGKLYTQEVIKVFDHDFTYLADGMIIP